MRFRTSSMILLTAAWLLLLSFPVIVIGAVLDSRSHLGSAELSLNGLHNHNVSGLADRSPKCTTSKRWIEPPYKNERCVEALNTLYQDYVRRLGTTEFEFIAPGAIPTHGPLALVTTPKRWSTGMLSIIHATDAVEQEMHKYTKTAK